ncbi:MULTISPECIES: DUF6928 family protein [unclassified Corynebacterium]|uniref:DUF6928 family protein n=1 Tax=unclassified Corynebacterium TaxID=2624378 RepID=UPI0029CA8BE0|nr:MULTISPECIES: hypothetical protein [unclassified Corynebacterium]WPF66741.1 hypothetical protein OLX12_03165 [Corynebacterium sp. 22KM0430]WPF69229.1 hypothetical protein OLW90_03160 [Corynebacterium sp. 21KM1197]
MSMYEKPVTLWFVSAPDPASVLAGEPRADRGFGRKYLAQLNPSWPVTPIGQFPFNRSAPASRGEFYIAAFPGVALVHTLVEDASRLSRLDASLRTSIPARDVYAISAGEGDFGAFAHWHEGTLQRSLGARREELFEDIGLPEAFEGPYWAGERADQPGGIALPFIPADLAREAQRSWLGVNVSPEGPDIQVAGFAIDGRPEPRVDEPSGSRMSMEEWAADATAKLGLSPANKQYDDYERHKEGDEFARLAEGITRRLRSWWRFRR